jgi:hypothetical protein
MRGVREPLLWIALASLVAFLPFSTVGLPVSAALALSIQCLLRTRLGSHARPALLVAVAAAWFTFALHSSLLSPHAPPFVLYRLAALSMPVTLLALASALSRMADVAALEESNLWLSGVRVLFLGGIAFDVLTPGAGMVTQFLACPIFAVLVLRMRASIALQGSR